MSKKFFSKSKSQEPKLYLYEAVRQELRSDELGEYVTYGIRASSNEQQIAFVSDVSTDKQAVQHLAELCTSDQLDPIHLNDIVEDFLMEVTMA